MSAERDPNSVQGRPIELTPVPRGVWLVVLGSGVAALAPLFGFLIGSVVGTEDEILGVSSIFLFLFLGFIVAGVGLGIAILGVRRILRDRRTSTD